MPLKSTGLVKVLDSEQFSLANGRIDGADQILFTMDDKSKGKLLTNDHDIGNEMAAQNNASVNVSIEITEEKQPCPDAFAWTRARQNKSNFNALKSGVD